MTTFKYFWDDKIKENKTGWACGTYRENVYRVLLGRLGA